MHVTRLQQTRLDWLSSTYRAGCVVHDCSCGLAIEKRERRDGGCGMEMMERRGGGFAMEKRERSVLQRLIRREGRYAVTGSKSKSIYPSINKATPH